MTMPAPGDKPTGAMLAQLLAALFLFSGKQTVSTSQTTTSTTYTDLATVGPQVSVTSKGTKALVLWKLTQLTTSGSAGSSPAVSGATTIASSDAEGLVGSDGGKNQIGFALLTITPGTNVYTLKYRVSGGTGTFLDRMMVVLAP